MKEGTSRVLLQSGLDCELWVDSMECYSYLRNIQDLWSDGRTPYDRRFGMPFEGPVIPFWINVEYHPISAKDQSGLHPFGAKVLPGIFLSCALSQTLKNLDEMDASKIHARRLNAKEVLTPQRGGNFIFPVADGTVKIFGREQRLRTSTSIRDRPERGEEQDILKGKSDELQSSTPLQEDSTHG